jgi:predicted O-linked N-acetylglucosamine transferase (SPINDLY family)
MSDYTELCALSDRALEMATLDTLHSVWEGRLYHWIYHPDLSAQEICAEHVKWGGRFAGLIQGGFDGHDRSLERPLRVGYISPDFRGHSCRFYFEPLFAEHSHKNFEFFAYSNVLVEDDHTHRMKSYFDKWTSILGISDDMVAELIRRDEIDILVDGCGHMMDTRLSVFAHKPAPIQVTWLGAAWTTGLPQMDYVLFDPFMAPEGTATSEKILRLPRTWAAFRPSEKAKQVNITPSPAAINGRVTFGYSGRSERLNYRVFRVWAHILNRLPEARLVLDYKAFIDPKTQEYFKGILEINGVDTARLMLRNSENIFKGLGDIDILLDSFPHSGGTMLFDAAWMGVPIVTLASDRPVGRIGASLMMNLGLPDWVATDEQEYEDKAVRFAQNIPALASLRSDMRTRMQSSPVMDEKSFARDVESAYQEMWRTWVGTAP